MRRLAVDRRVDVRAAAEHEAVEPVQQPVDVIHEAMRRQHDREPAGLLHRLRVGQPQREPVGGEVALAPPGEGRPGGAASARNSS